MLGMLYASGVNCITVYVVYRIDVTRCRIGVQCVALVRTCIVILDALCVCCVYVYVYMYSICIARIQCIQTVYQHSILVRYTHMFSGGYLL